MKTLILQSADQATNVQVKVDIFATLAQLQEDGFDTRFTGMEIQDDFDAIAKGVNIMEIEHNWQSIIALAKQLDLGLSVIDINSPTGKVEILALPSQD